MITITSYSINCDYINCCHWTKNWIILQVFYCLVKHLKFKIVAKIAVFVVFSKLKRKRGFFIAWPFPGKVISTAESLSRFKSNSKPSGQSYKTSYHFTYKCFHHLQNIQPLSKRLQFYQPLFIPIVPKSCIVFKN